MYKVINQGSTIYLDTHCYECKKEFEDNEDRYHAGYVICTLPAKLPFFCKSCSKK